jgi:hypothetical protein
MPKGTLMSCEHLICARCAGPVVEGRCPACREARSQVHHSQQMGIPLLIAALFAVLLVMIALQLTH